MEKLDSVKADFAEQLRADTDGLFARLKETNAGGESIIDTPSIMQSTLLDEIMDLKRALDENSVTKDYLNESVDRILEQFKSFLGEAEDRKQENDREREQYVATQFSTANSSRNPRNPLRKKSNLSTRASVATLPPRRSSSSN